MTDHSGASDTASTGAGCPLCGSTDPNIYLGKCGNYQAKKEPAHIFHWDSTTDVMRAMMRPAGASDTVEGATKEETAVTADEKRDEYLARAAQQVRIGKTNIESALFAVYCAGSDAAAETLEAREAWAAERTKALEQVIEHDRSKVCDGVNTLKKILREREWLGEGRGPCAWDDDRWHDEFKDTAAEIREAFAGLEKIAADLSNSPSKWADVLEARGKAEAERDRLAKALTKAKVKYSRDHGMPNPSEPFPTHVEFSLVDWKAVADWIEAREALAPPSRDV